MSDEELERLAKAAAEAVGPKWRFVPTSEGSEGWVDSEALGKNIGTGYDGEWEANAARFAAAACPATVLALLERVRKAEVDVSDATEWVRALEVRIDSWRELHKEAEERAKAAEDVALEMAAKAVENAPASFNRNDHAERIRALKSKP